MVSRIFWGIALFSLMLCLAAPYLYFLGRMSERGYKLLFLLASIAWFLFSVLRMLYIRKMYKKKKS